MKATATAWGTVRRAADDGSEWISVLDIGYSQQEVAKKIQDTKENIPLWDLHNPVIRIVPMEIREAK